MTVRNDNSSLTPTNIKVCITENIFTRNIQARFFQSQTSIIYTAGKNSTNMAPCQHTFTERWPKVTLLYSRLSFGWTPTPPTFRRNEIQGGCNMCVLIKGALTRKANCTSHWIFSSSFFERQRRFHIESMASTCCRARYFSLRSFYTQNKYAKR